ncbi:MAG: DUF1800 domain-containing protein [Rhodanobacteraceae bacterium]|nr:DUF1800 domain-containing protein [Rhodanobacteraceae bacterium]MBK7042326.1 DUF1800 domain-containing protein [Rhodanobacteraceae bacterium]MBP9154796.1 DUF1800 domain-containing protein [Xanthomonadales bacterium]HQW80813.1 DUF1800 domain-containing protein [Pseudomonadota bacterium]
MNPMRRQFLGDAPAAVTGDSKHKGLLQDDTSLPLPDDLTLLLSRTTFGARQQEVDHARAIGYANWVAEQLAYTSIDDSALENLLTAAFPTLAMSNRQLIENSLIEANRFQALGELRAATYARQLYSPRQLFEVMVEFWSNHFNIEHIDGPLREFKTVDDREVVRRHALGKFRDLLQASAKSVAMLYYLDNYTNVATGPNENYARELMELHTLGVDGGYTETDVKEVARILTGWSIDARLGNGTEISFVFRTLSHDMGAKRALDNEFPAGHSQDEGERLLDLLAAHPSTARFIARKLAMRFAGDAPASTLIDAMAATFMASDGDICEVLRTLFNSSEFRNSADQKLKRPSEFVASVLRATNATTTGNFYRPLTATLTTLGQVPYGWPAPNGYPDVMGYWISTTSVLSRWNFVFDLLEGRLAPQLRVDLAAMLGLAASPEAIVDQLATRLLRRPLADADRAQFVAVAASNSLARRALPSGLRLARARDVAALMLSSPYFQYR